MIDQQEPIPAGALFTVTAGSYSDYRVHGVFRVLKQLDLKTQMLCFLLKNPKQRDQYQFSESDFLAFLATEGIIEDVDCWDLWLGDEWDEAEIKRWREDD